MKTRYAGFCGTRPNRSGLFFRATEPPDALFFPLPALSISDLPTIEPGTRGREIRPLCGSSQPLLAAPLIRKLAQSLVSRVISWVLSGMGFPHGFSQRQFHKSGDHGSFFSVLGGRLPLELFFGNRIEPNMKHSTHASDCVLLRPSCQ